MLNEGLREWLDTGVALAKEQPELRPVIAQGFYSMTEEAYEDSETEAVYVIIGEALDTVKALDGPLSELGSCLCCTNPVSEGGCQLCDECQSDHGADPERWPPWIRRIADDRAARLAVTA